MQAVLLQVNPPAILKNLVIRYHKRDIVLVVTKEKRQPFYKSTGHSSKMPDTWLPFDGIMYPNCWGAEWFDKQAYTINPECPEDRHGFGDLHRFGTQYNKDISDALKAIDIPQGIEAESGRDVNLFLGVASKYEPNMAKILQYSRSMI